MSSEYNSEATVAGASAHQYRLSDWLNLHSLDRSKCRQIVGLVSDPPPVIKSEPDNEQNVLRSGDGSFSVGYSANEAWSLAADSLGKRFPSHRSLVQRVKENTTTNFQPDVAQYPLAFTVRLECDSYPSVSCNYQGHIEDLITVAHEFGHALQIVVSDGAFIPPVMRELCAYYGELALVEYLKDEHTALHSIALEFRARQIDQFRCDRTLNNSVMGSVDSKYDYRWNYLFAQALSTPGYALLTSDCLWRCFAGQISADALLNAIINARGINRG